MGKNREMIKRKKIRTYKEKYKNKKIEQKSWTDERKSDKEVFKRATQYGRNGKYDKKGENRDVRESRKKYETKKI